MIFQKHYQIKWHDTDLNRRVRPSQLLMYLQETANLHLRENGMDLDRLRDERQLGFLLSRMSVRVLQQLYAQDEIDTQTWVCPGRGMAFDRCFRMLRNGETVAEGYSVWGLMDLSTQKMVRQEDFSYPFTPEPPFKADPPLRFRVPPVTEMELAGSRRIVYSDVDYNGHMNNTRYPDMLCDFIPDMQERQINGFSLSYLHEAPLGKELNVYRQSCGDEFLFRTTDPDGNTCLEARVLTSKLPH